MKRIFVILVAIIATSITTQAQTKTQPSVNTNLFEAVKDNNMNDFLLALNQGANPDAGMYEDSPRTTSFIKAIVLNRIEMVKIMIKHGADVNKLRPSDSNSPAMIAARNNHAVILQLLVNAGADVNYTTIFNRTALQVAASNNALDAAKVLIAHPNMDVNNRGRLCAMAVAARDGHVDFVKLLLPLKGNKTPSQKCYKSALEMAKENQHTEIVNLLK